MEVSCGGVKSTRSRRRMLEPFLKMLVVFFQLAPLFVIVSIPCAMGASFSFYSLATKMDVRVDKSKEIPPWERAQPTDYNKFLTINRKYIPNNELDSLRKEIGSYKL